MYVLRYVLPNNNYALSNQIVKKRKRSYNESNFFEDLFEEENAKEKVEVAEIPVPLSPLQRDMELMDF